MADGTSVLMHGQLNRNRREAPGGAVIRGIAIALAVAVGWCGLVPDGVAGEFTAAIRSARDQFQPIGDEQLAAARDELATQMRSLERFVNPRSANGKKWLAYLEWEPLQTALASEDAPELGPLVATLDRLNRDQTGLELAPFRRVADALRHYLDLAAMARQQDQAATYARQLEALDGELDRYAEQPSEPLRSAIGQRLDMVAALGQAPELVEAVRRKFVRPNALITISAKYLRDAIAKPIDRHDPVTDTILGTRIRGQGHTTGTMELRLIPTEDHAVVELTTDGNVVSQNVGRNGPAVIRSTGRTSFQATQIVELADDGFRAQPAKVSARTGSDLHSVSKAGGGIGRRVVASQGMSRAREKQGQANAISADHAEDRIARRMNDEVSDRLNDAWQNYQDNYRLPLVRRGALPDEIRFTSTEDAIALEVIQAQRAQLGAPGEPAPSPDDKDMVLRVHESGVNNYLAAILGGATISQSDADADTHADVNLPEFIKTAWKKRMDDKAEDAGDGDFEPWSLTFRRDRPMTAAFQDGKVALTIHLAHLESGDDQFDRWDVTGSFTPELTDGGVTLRREGELVVFPTDFDPQRGSLSSRQAALRRNLTNVLTRRSDEGRGFPQTIKIEKREPSEDFAHVGPLLVDEFTSASGWLTVAWNRE